MIMFISQWGDPWPDTNYADVKYNNEGSFMAKVRQPPPVLKMLIVQTMHSRSLEGK
jgi:hypothetical protein